MQDQFMRAQTQRPGFDRMGSTAQFEDAVALVPELPQTSQLLSHMHSLRGAKGNDSGKEPELKNRSAVEWWRYCITCMVKDIRMKRGKWGEFRIDPLRRKAYQRSMVRILHKALNEDGAIAYELLTEEDRYLYHHILAATELPDLKRWVGFMVKKKFEKSNTAEQDGSAGGGILTGWLSWGFRKQEME